SDGGKQYGLSLSHRDRLALFQFPVAPESTVLIDGRKAKVTDLKMGMHVSFRMTPDQLTIDHIEAQAGYLLKGVDLKKQTISVALGGKTLFKDLFAKDADVYIDGEPEALERLKAGMRITLELGTKGGQMVVKEIRVRQ